MKKALLLLVILALLLSIGCSKKDEAPKEESKEEEASVNSDNFFLTPKIVEVPVTNATGEKIGTRAYIDTTKILFFEELEGSEKVAGYIKELFESGLKDKNYNWFNINLEDGSTLFFAGANYEIIEYHENPEKDGKPKESATATYVLRDGSYQKAK